MQLFGVDCPEYNQPWCKAVKRHTARLMGKRVTVQAIDFDRHKRLVAKITTPDGQDLVLELIKASLSRWYKRYSPNEKADNNAPRKANHGLWADPESIPPWKWR
jgi:micrococcal nuclease